MNSEQIYKMLAKYLSGEASPDEIKNVNDWINENPGNQLFYDDVKAVWENSLSNNKNFDVNSAWENVKPKLSSSSNEDKKLNHAKSNAAFQYFNYLKIAAAIIIMMGFTFLYFNKFYMLESRKSDVQIKQITSNKGEIRKVRLDDGTVVTLNSNSILETPSKFSERNRTVSLIGEAYFEVAHDIKKPFIVSTKNTTIKVIGTKFNITSWEENEEVIVSVSEGKVLFGSNETNKHVYINKGEMSTASKNNAPLRPVKVDVEKYYLFWLYDELNFYNTPFKNIIQRLESKYGINISVEDLSILSKHLTANFKNEPIGEILNTISIALDLKYSTNNNLIVFGYDD